MQLEGKIAIVTGGGQGLGEAISRALAQAKVSVVIGDVQADKAKQVAQDICDQGGQAVGMALDVRDETSVKAIVDAALQQYGRVDILVNNAGTDRTVPVSELSVEDWDRVVGVNLRGPFLMVKHVLPHLYKQQSGHVINIASTAAKRMWPNAAAYHASKWGLVGLSHALFTEAREQHVKVSAVIAGGMRTPFILDRFPDTPLSKLQDPKNVADTVVYVLSQPDETIIPEVMVVPITETSWP